MKTFKRILIILFVLIVVTGLGVGMYGYSFYEDKLDEQPLADKVSDVRNDVNFVSIEDVPKDYINAVIAVEDHRYYDHGAIDIIGLGRAIFTNIKNGEMQEGGSTITQQVAKNLYFIGEDNVLEEKLLKCLWQSI